MNACINAELLKSQRSPASHAPEGQMKLTFVLGDLIENTVVPNSGISLERRADHVRGWKKWKVCGSLFYRQLNHFTLWLLLVEHSFFISAHFNSTKLVRLMMVVLCPNQEPLGILQLSLPIYFKLPLAWSSLDFVSVLAKKTRFLLPGCSSVLWC
jgi:hypothetical protein